MTTEQQYVSLNENMEHLQRHFAGAETVGSKFLPDAKGMVIDRVKSELMKKFFEEQETGKPVGRVVLSIDFPKAVGTDALVALKDHGDQNQVRVIRDGGTPIQSVVTAVETSAAPKTKKVTVIAGPYGDTGKWGIFTMFPGAEAPAFPDEKKQTDPVRQANEKFWNEHGFLATRNEIAAHPREDGKPHAFTSASASKGPKAHAQKR